MTIQSKISIKKYRQDNDRSVICPFPSPELPLLFGPINKIYSAPEPIWPQSMYWLKALNVKKEEYHCGRFADNNSRNLPQNVGCLKALNPPSSYGKFVRACNSFNKVVSSCYGTELHPEFQCKIAIFSKDYMKLSITVTPKVHAVMFYVAEFCLIMG